MEAIPQGPSLTREHQLGHTIYTNHDLHSLDNVIAMTFREIKYFL